eukprot:217776-Amphidinium_carterae.1
MMNLGVTWSVHVPRPLRHATLVAINGLLHMNCASRSSLIPPVWKTLEASILTGAQEPEPRVLLGDMFNCVMQT